MLRTKLTAGAMSAVLAVTLCPGLAMAAPLGTGSIADDGDNSATLTTQKDKKVWVLNKVDGAEWFTYNKHGLVKTTLEGYKLKYSGKHLRTIKGATVKYKIFWKHGQMNRAYRQTATFDDDGNLVWGNKTDYAYTLDGKGMICKQVGTTKTKKWLDKNLKDKRVLSTETVDIARNSQGLPIQSRTYTWDATGSTSTNMMLYYNFDGNKNLSRVKGTNLRPVFFQSRMLKGRISRTTMENWDMNAYDWSTDYMTTHKYSYKKMKVPEKYLPVIKQQQWALNNLNLNKAFGPADEVGIWALGQNPWYLSA